MKKKEKKLPVSFIIVFSIILLSAAVYFLIIFLKAEKLKSQIALINIYYQNEDYETARTMIEGIIMENSKNKELLAFFNEILKADREKKELEELSKQGKIDEFNQLLIRLLYQLLAQTRSGGSVQTKIINKNWSDNPELNLLIDEGIRYYEQGKIALAKAKLKTAVMVDEENPYANAYLAAVLFAENPENESNIKEASIRCNKALNMNSSVEIAHITLGMIYVKKKLYDEAIGELTDTIKINPNNYKASFELGKVYLNRNDIENARRFFLLSINSKKDFIDAYYYLGEIELKNGDYSKAKAHYESIIRYDGNYFNAYMKLADIYKAENQYNKAVEYYREAYKLDKNYKAVYELGNCYKILNENDKSINYFNESLSLNPGINREEKEYRLKTYQGLLEIYNKTGNKKKTEEINNIIKKITQ